MTILSSRPCSVFSVAAAVALAACTERAPSAPPRLIANAQSERTVVGAADDWDTFAADITVQTQRFGSGGRLLIRTQPLSLHVERHLRNGTNWDFVMTLPSRYGLATEVDASSAAPRGSEAARFEDDGDGTPPRIYDDIGRLMPTQLPNLPANLASRLAAFQAAIAGGALGGTIGHATVDRQVASQTSVAATASPDASPSSPPSCETTRGNEAARLMVPRTARRSVAS